MSLPATQTQHGYLVLADISGYTSYLAGVELDHAHEILTDLLETVVGKFKPLLTICKLEGDAVFAYTPESSLTRGETMFEVVESAYVAFCDRRESTHRRTTCECRACRNIRSLDLKFFVHHGDFIVQHVSGIRELMGSDVNLVHRLMKNHLAQATGWTAYAMFTEQGLEHLEVRPVQMHALVETYDHLGPVQTYSLDLQARRQEILNARRDVISPDEADYVVTQEYPAPPAIVWEWLTEPRKRTLWGQDSKWRAGHRPNGRTGIGAHNHCDHGKTTTLETILDWRPFEYFTSRTEDDRVAMVDTFYLEPTAGGDRTLIRDAIRFERFPFPLPRPLAVPLMRFLMKKLMNYEDMLGGITNLIVAEQARQQQELSS